MPILSYEELKSLFRFYLKLGMSPMFVVSLLHVFNYEYNQNDLDRILGVIYY